MFVQQSLPPKKRGSSAGKANLDARLALACEQPLQQQLARGSSQACQPSELPTTCQAQPGPRILPGSTYQQHAAGHTTVRSPACVRRLLLDGAHTARQSGPELSPASHATCSGIKPHGDMLCSPVAASACNHRARVGCATTDTATQQQQAQLDGQGKPANTEHTISQPGCTSLQRMDALWAFLEKCDSDAHTSGLTQILENAPQHLVNKTASQLRKRSAWLCLEEAREYKRASALNVMQLPSPSKRPTPPPVTIAANNAPSPTGAAETSRHRPIDVLGRADETACHASPLQPSRAGELHPAAAELHIANHLPSSPAISHSASHMYCSAPAHPDVATASHIHHPRGGAVDQRFDRTGIVSPQASPRPCKTGVYCSSHTQAQEIRLQQLGSSLQAALDSGAGALKGMPHDACARQQLRVSDMSSPLSCSALPMDGRRSAAGSPCSLKVREGGYNSCEAGLPVGHGISIAPWTVHSVAF